MKTFRRKTYAFWVALIFIVFFLSEGLNAAVVISFFLVIGYYAAVFASNIEVTNQSIKIGQKEIRPTSIKRAEFKTKFIAKDKNDGLTLLLEKNPEPNNYVLNIYLNTIGEGVNIILGDYKEMEVLIHELERFFIDNSIPYEKEDFKYVYIP